MTDATAPYRFVPIEPGLVVAPPVRLEDLRFDQPLAEGSISATLEVEWEAKTPICVGDQGDNTPAAAKPAVEPIQVGGRYCLPGSTLRGMVRAVVEAATFSHLGRINSHHHHGRRDFQGLPRHPHHSIKVGDIKAGWLSWDGKDWVLRPAKGKSLFVLAPMTDLLDRLRQEGHDLSVSRWRSMQMWEKYALLPESCVKRPIKDLYEHGGTTTFSGAPPKVLTRRPKGQMLNNFRSATHPTKDVVVVCTGPAVEDPGGKLKSTESLFPLPGETAVRIPSAWMRVFHGMHSDPGRDGGNPRGAWRAWLLAYGWEKDAVTGFEPSDQDAGIRHAMRGARTEEKPGAPCGIPVFWKGSMPDEGASFDETVGPGRQSFWFSLSRVMRVPYDYSVGEIAQRLYGGSADGEYHPPRLREDNGWDFARALFGEVDGANWTVGSRQEQTRADGTVTEDAVRGRVAFDFAWAEGNPRPAEMKQGVFAQPRESFWPFYLRHRDAVDTTVSYTSDHAVPAGRKRAVVRPCPKEEWPQGNEDEKGQAKNNDILTNIRFLPKGTKFRGRIRVHNLHPAEFGALIWALSFGDPTGAHWHLAGRAKGMGHGALRPAIRFAKPPMVTGAARNVPEGATDPFAWLRAFEDYMDEQMKIHGQTCCHRDHPSIGALRETANPETGRRLAATLSTASLEQYTRLYKSMKPDQKHPYPLPLK